jgi:hypothetical protein
MFLILEVVTVFLVAVTMSLALAHALEFPGKMRLDEKTYLAVQTIYYPGFTLGGIAEPLAIIATLVLMVLMRDRGAAFWWALTAFAAVVAMHAVFWLVTQPTNRYWLKSEKLSRAGAQFFSVEQRKEQRSTETVSEDWRRLRDRWEYSHVIRAVLSCLCLIALVVAVAT